jgi:hypothetical protein
MKNELKDISVCHKLNLLEYLCLPFYISTDFALGTALGFGFVGLEMVESLINRWRIWRGRNFIFSVLPIGMGIFVFT